MFGAKRPGFEMQTATVNMDFCYQSGFGVESPDAYEMLLLDVMQGEATLFIRDEAEHQWRLITPIQSLDQLGLPKAGDFEAGNRGRLKLTILAQKRPPLAKLKGKNRL